MRMGWVAGGIVGITGLGLATLCGLVPDRHSPPVLVNESPSVPKGLYLRLGTSSPEPGDIVGLRQPQMARAYLGGLGIPPDLLLLKRLAGRPGDTVCRHNRLVTTPRLRVQALEADSQGRPLPTWAGCRLLGRDEVFLLGDTGSSFDSRYFGPVGAGEITGVYGALVSW